jgi:AcrR family transcriptional regulator
LSSNRDEIRQKIVDAALKIADEEGFEAVSMRRIATAVDMGTMSLYTYVKSKDELVFLAGEQIGSEILLDEVPGDWREALTAIAQKSRDVMIKRPWIMQISGDEVQQMPPSFVRHVDQSLQAIEPLGVDYETGMEILRAVDSVAMGTALDDNHESEMSAEKEREFLVEMEKAGRELELPRIAEAAAHGMTHTPVFDRALKWLLDGIEAEYGGGSGSRSGD